MESANILRSTLISLSKLKNYLRTELSPSVSIIISTESLSISTGLPHIHKPFVQGMVVGPIANPVILFSKRLERKDLPVRWGPAIEATAIYDFYVIWYFFVLNAIKHLGSLLCQLELMLDNIAFEPFLDHDKRNGLSIDFLVHDFQKIVYKCNLTQRSFDLWLYFYSFLTLQKRIRMYRPVIVSNASTHIKSNYNLSIEFQKKMSRRENKASLGSALMGVLGVVIGAGLGYLANKILEPEP